MPGKDDPPAVWRAIPTPAIHSRLRTPRPAAQVGHRPPGNSMPLRQVSRWRGHSSIKITADPYGHLTLDGGERSRQITEAALGYARCSTNPQLREYPELSWCRLGREVEVTDASRTAWPGRLRRGAWCAARCSRTGLPGDSRRGTGRHTYRSRLGLVAPNEPKPGRADFRYRPFYAHRDRRPPPATRPLSVRRTSLRHPVGAVTCHHATKNDGWSSPARRYPRCSRPSSPCPA